MKNKSRINLLFLFKVLSALLSLMLLLTACGTGSAHTGDSVPEQTDSTLDGCVMLQGYDLSMYEIVYSNQNANSEVLAWLLANEIRDLTELQLTVKSDDAEITGREILIGATNRTGCPYTTQSLKAGAYLIGVDETSICARGADAVGTRYAVFDLINAFTESLEEGTEVVLADSKVAMVPESDTLKAMSFNILYNNITTERNLSVVHTILRSLPDTFGIQEGIGHWIQYFKDTLGDIYGSVGIGREGDSDSEHTAVYYRKDRFDLVEGGTKWMSDTPDEPSKFEESSQKRIFTYVILADKRTAEKILVVNVHLEQTNDPARKKQTAVLLDFIQQYPQYPLVLTGDFNTQPTSDVYKTIAEQLSDASEIAEVAEKSYTFIGRKTTIDFIFVRDQMLDVLNYRVITGTENGMVPSDHFPIIMEYKLTKTESKEG